MPMIVTINVSKLDRYCKDNIIMVCVLTIKKSTLVVTKHTFNITFMAIMIFG